MPNSYSISGPTTGPIVVPRNAAWETPAWTWAFWTKSPGGMNHPGAFSTSTSGNPTTAGVCFELFDAGLFVDVNGSQIPVADLTGGGVASRRGGHGRDRA